VGRPFFFFSLRIRVCSTSPAQSVSDLQSRISFGGFRPLSGRRAATLQSANQASPRPVLLFFLSFPPLLDAVRECVRFLGMKSLMGGRETHERHLPGHPVLFFFFPPLVRYPAPSGNLVSDVGKEKLISLEFSPSLFSFLFFFFPSDGCRGTGRRTLPASQLPPPLPLLSPSSRLAIHVIFSSNKGFARRCLLGRHHPLFLPPPPPPPSFSLIPSRFKDRNQGSGRNRPFFSLPPLSFLILKGANSHGRGNGPRMKRGFPFFLSPLSFPEKKKPPFLVRAKVRDQRP